LTRIYATSEPVVWGLGLFRDPVIAYPSASGSGFQERRPYFFSDPRFANKTMNDIIDFLLGDYNNAVKRADALDARIRADAMAVSPNDNEQYYNLVAMAAKQTVAAVDITYAYMEEGRSNKTDIKSFMRNMGFDA
jgi:hypothetical protein